MKDDLIDSKSLLMQFLKDEKLYSGVELILHCIATAAVKVSVESVVESLVSRYEVHFDASRQLDEDHALQEMEIAENGPEFVDADYVIRNAMDRYLESGASCDIRTYSVIICNRVKSFW